MMSGTERSIWLEDRASVSPWTEERSRTWQDGGADGGDALGPASCHSGTVMTGASAPGAERADCGKEPAKLDAVRKSAGGMESEEPGIPAPPAPSGQETEETKRLRENFGLIAPAALLYAVFYCLCMYRNGSGITFPFFVGGSLIFLRFSSSRLGITLKRGSAWYMAAMLLLGLSTFCTDDSRIIFFNKLGVFLLTMSLLLKQFFDTSAWKLGKYLASICQLVFASFGELGRPFHDGAYCEKNRKKRRDRRGWYAALGLLIGAPLLLAVILLLASADAIFGRMAYAVLEAVNPLNLFHILVRVAAVFFGSYALIAYLCKRRIREEVTDRRKGEPVLAVTITGLLTAVYLLFCGIQIGGLFLGRLSLPQGYTYAMYAREGFFQLLAVSSLNLMIVLACLNYFRESSPLKWILTLMSLCTFVMIASSAMRMIIYIRYYYLTFLRILVLWGLGLLAVLFVGVVVSTWKERFPLFGYSMTAVAVCYLALSFAHPDYVIAKVNVANAPKGDAAWQDSDDSGREGMGGFFLAEEPYQDYEYLQRLSADAAPVLVPYLEELGYRLEAFGEPSSVQYAMDRDEAYGSREDSSFWQRTFGYWWMDRWKLRMGETDFRTFNLSRWLAQRYLKERQEMPLGNIL